MIKPLISQSSHGFFLKMFSKSWLWWFNVNVLIVKWISIQLHDEPMFPPILKITLCYGHCDLDYVLIEYWSYYVELAITTVLYSNWWWIIDDSSMWIKSWRVGKDWLMFFYLLLIFNVEHLYDLDSGAIEVWFRLGYDIFIYWPILHNLWIMSIDYWWSNQGKFGKIDLCSSILYRLIMKCV